jgi:hypothetical protein
MGVCVILKKWWLFAERRVAVDEKGKAAVLAVPEGAPSLWMGYHNRNTPYLQTKHSFDCGDLRVNVVNRWSDHVIAIGGIASALANLVAFWRLYAASAQSLYAAFIAASGVSAGAGVTNASDFDQTLLVAAANRRFCWSILPRWVSLPQDALCRLKRCIDW